MRKVAIFGGLLASVSLFLSTFSPNVQVMIVLYGALGGSGLGLLYFPGFVLITQYFNSKRGIAAGIAFCGSGVVGFVFAPLMDFLITTYSWKGAVWIVSAIILNCVALGALLRPLDNKNIRRKMDQEKKHISRNKRCMSSCSCDVSSFFDLEVLKSPSLWVYGMSCFICNIGFYIPFTFLPDLADSFGMTSQQGAMLISIIGILNTIGRVAAGWVADRKWADTTTIDGVALIIGGVATLFVPKYTLYAISAVYCGVFGIIIAVFITFQPIISHDLSGPGQTDPFYSIVCMLQGIAAIIGPPVAGVLADNAGNYDGSFYLAGISIVVSGILCLPLNYINRWEMKRLKRKETKHDEACESCL
ncbi:monocarboxylate transporter 12-like [Mercenaria mercenaria]|uniref:monocarboxylate transporter 12-like n=1 Tax=Mercenaria mercenaria TaxID=6596 RepID=UPI00234E767E|nr:monocarboxylate transporter 12-like [Mercenaria mercenaria]